jgi:ABC-2 type transport system permease protein
MTYARAELLRTMRNPRFFIFSLGFPLILYFVIAAPNRNVTDFSGSGISLPLYYMVGLMAFGTMSAVIASGARIAVERQSGWTRQLRITPMRTRTYFGGKILTGYGMAVLTMLLLSISGLILGVSLPAGDWLLMSLLILIGLVPFAVLGILLGHLLNSESVGPAVGGTISILALISGTWFPLGNGIVHDIVQFLPSYWLVQASHVALGGSAWPPFAWGVVIVWTVVLLWITVRVYRRDTQRV